MAEIVPTAAIESPKNRKLVALISASAIILFTCALAWYLSRGTEVPDNKPSNRKISPPAPPAPKDMPTKFMLDRICIEKLPARDSTYKGLVIDYHTPITADWVQNKLIPYFQAELLLDPKSAYMILLRGAEIFGAEKPLVKVNLASEESLTVVGDVHGQFFDVLTIFQNNKYPSATNKYLFNGDIVDRGNYSIECLLTLLAYKIALPKSFFMTRGNHETPSINNRYGFLDECKRKYNEEFHSLVNHMMINLPFAYVIQDKIFVVHGGLPDKKDFKLTDFETLTIQYTPPPNTLFSQLLWSDPQEAYGKAESPRGDGILFGPDITEDFLKRNKLNCIIRSHQEVKGGYKWMHNDKCLTVFSAPNYGGNRNMGAYALIKPDLTIKVEQFGSAEFQGKYPNI